MDFPQSLPGIDISVTRTPVYATVVQTSANGVERRFSRWSTPKFRFTVTFNVLRDGYWSSNAAATLLDVFHTLAGQQGDCWFNDTFDKSKRKVRFASDELEMERFLAGRWRTSKIELLTTGESQPGNATTGLGDLLGDALGA